MGIFRNININLYKMYFKESFGLNSQYEYLKCMYSWNPSAVKKFEQGKFNVNDIAYKWMKNGISPSFLLADPNEDMLHFDSLFDICYFHLRNKVCLENNCNLTETIRKIIYSSETSIDEPFAWEISTKKRMINIFEKYDTIQTLCTLLIYAQIGEIYTLDGKYHFKNAFKYVKSYKKEIVNWHFDELLKDAVEINMSQISIPSIMPYYDDFFKKNNRNNIFCLLENNPEFRLKILMIDPELQNLDFLLQAYMYGDAFSDSKKVVEDSVNFAVNLAEQFPDQVIAKVVSVPMSYSFMQIKKKLQPSIVKIDVYTPMNNADDRFSFIFDDVENKELYDYYVKTFCRMFGTGKSID